MKTTLALLFTLTILGTSLTLAQTGMEGSPELPSNKPGAQDPAPTENESTDTEQKESKPYTCEKRKLVEGSPEDKQLLEDIAKETDKKRKETMTGCRELRLQWEDSKEDEQKLEELNTGQNDPAGDDTGEKPAPVAGGSPESPVNKTPETNDPDWDPVKQCSTTDNDCVNAPTPTTKPGAAASAYGSDCVDNDCMNAQDGLYETSFDPAQAPMNTDASYKCVVTTCDRSAWVDAGKVDQKRLLEEGAAKYFNGVDTSNYKFNQINPEEASKIGTIDPEYKTPAFAKMMDEHIAPDLWKNTSLEQRQLLATNYLTNVTGRYTPNQAAGIVGNFTAESNMNPYLNAKGSENSSGLAQWNGASAAGRRQQALEAYAGKQFAPYQNINGQEIHPDGPGGTVQVAYADAEMQGYAANPDAGAIRAGRKFASNPDMSVSQATQVFGQDFERPLRLSDSIAHRQSAAQTALSNFAAANGGAISGGGVPPPTRVAAGSSPVGRTTANTLNAALSPQGVSTPPATLSNLGSTLGSSFSGPQGLQGLQSTGAQSSPISNLLGNLFGVKPSTSGSSSALPSTTNTNNTTQQLNTLLNQQQQQLTQFAATSQTSGADLSKLKTLLTQHQSQLKQFAIQYPTADQNYLKSLETLLGQQITQIDQLIRQQSQQTISQSSYTQQVQRLIAEQQEQQQAVINNQGNVITNATPGNLNTSVQSDLTVTALRANSTLSDEYRFRGSLSRILKNSGDHLAFSEIGSYFGSDVQHELLLDLKCDGTIDNSVQFKTPYYSILPRSDGADVLLSEYLKVTSEGLHCFAFKVDVDNDIPETNESNNTSNWREFIVGFGGSSSEVSLPPLNFEVSAYTSNYQSVTQNWTSEDIVIGEGQELAFRWDAPQYQQCIPLLSSLTPDFASNLVPIERNTLSENIDVHEHTGYYELRCSIDGNTRVETVWVGVE